MSKIKIIANKNRLGILKDNQERYTTPKEFIENKGLKQIELQALLKTLTEYFGKDAKIIDVIEAIKNGRKN